MSETLKPWLFAHCTSQTSSALLSNFDLLDMPYLPGNRVQILRFLTFPSASSPCDVWTLIGDRTHCLAARFASSTVTHFHRTHPVSFTSLKGALLTLTHVAVRVARVAVHADSQPYRNGQYALMLDVKGFRVVSSVQEPVWYGGVKLVTSRNGVPNGQQKEYEEMIKWMKKWIRWKCVLRKAREERGKPKGVEVAEESVVGLPTPAQRRTVLVVSSSQIQPPQQQQEEESLESITQGATQRDALWTGFDLDADAEVDLDHLEVCKWGAVDVEVVAAETAAEEQVQPQQVAQSQTQTQPQPQLDADLDPDESGLSDYERQSRIKRRRLRAMMDDQSGGTAAAPPTTPTAPVGTAGQGSAEQRCDSAARPKSRSASATAPDQGWKVPSAPAHISPLAEKPATSELVKSTMLPSTASTPSPAATSSAPKSAPTHPNPPPPTASTTTHITTSLAQSQPTSQSSTSKTSDASAPPKHKRTAGKRKHRQAALAALMAQIVD